MNSKNLQGLVVALGVALAAVVAVGVWYVTQLQTEMAQLRDASSARKAPAPAAAAAAGAAAAAARAGRTLTPAQRTAMLTRLQQDSASKPPIWFATTNDPEAMTFQRTLQGVFEEAGWTVRGNAPVRFPVKPGIFMFSADAEPPSYVNTVGGALEAAELTVTAGTAYRDFYVEKKKDNPSWSGFELAPEQTYVVVVGRQPD